MGSTRFVFVTGGVVSSLGKGIAAASLGRLLVARGYRVLNAKLDPYLNVDPGTLNPSEHGEVFVTADRGETDLDLGHYERFVGVDLPAACSIAAGQVYSHVLGSERRGEYLGHTVQVIPHVTDEIQRRLRLITEIGDGPDVVIAEIGGTVGDIEIQPFLEAIRQFRAAQEPGATASVHLTLLPTVGPSRELKTKPSQHSVATLRSHGISPDVLMARSSEPVPDQMRAKLAKFCGLPNGRVVVGYDAHSIYAVPSMLAAEGFDIAVCDALRLDPRHLDLTGWDAAVANLVHPPAETVTVAVVCKYNDGADEYLSVCEALHHAAADAGVSVTLEWVDAATLEADVGAADRLTRAVDAVVVPGGFGFRGVEGKVAVAAACRTNRTPYLGLCLGLQVAAVAAARAAGIDGATSAEWGEPGPQVIALLDDQRGVVELGATMRLGAHPATLVAGSVVAGLYGADVAVERHRHRYEVNPAFIDAIESSGLRVSGRSPDGALVEYVEDPDHPFYVATQSHPEFTSRPGTPNPLFVGAIAAARAHRSLACVKA